MPRLLLALLALFPPWWNHAYVTQFYRTPPGFELPNGGYHRNTRYLTQARVALRDHRRVAFLPLPRDHGDHFLFLAARPDGEVRSACEAVTPDDLPFAITSYTAAVIRKEGGPAALVQVARGALTLTTVGALPREALTRWCARADLRPRPAAPRGSVP